jgi:hypothetical protein
MAKTKWLPARREGILTMAKDWVAVLHVRGVSWNITEAHMAELGELTADAEAALAAASGENTRNHVTVTRCAEAFKALEAFMRDLKKRYFFSPPLDAADFASLSLHSPDTVKTDVPVPALEAVADIAYPAPHLVELKNIRPLGEGADDPRAEAGARIHFGVLDAPDARNKWRIASPPATGDDLPHSRWSRHKKEVFDFEGDSGKTAYFCLRFENTKGQPGPFGPILQTVIP